MTRNKITQSSSSTNPEPKNVPSATKQKAVYNDTGSSVSISTLPVDLTNSVKISRNLQTLEYLSKKVHTPVTSGVCNLWKMHIHERE